ncbi:MAG: hypothetical protein WCL11_24635 [Verrucomicrobiota bacterium]
MLTWMVPLGPTVTASNPDQFVCHGPASDEAHSTPASMAGSRFVQTRTPFWLDELMTGS